jgi:hypothetical protein
MKSDTAFEVCHVSRLKIVNKLNLVRQVLECSALVLVTSSTYIIPDKTFMCCSFLNVPYFLYMICGNESKCRICCAILLLVLCHRNGIHHVNFLQNAPCFDISESVLSSAVLVWSCWCLASPCTFQDVCRNIVRNLPTSVRILQVLA